MFLNLSKIRFVIVTDLEKKYQMGDLIQIEATLVVLAMERGFYLNVYISVMSLIQHEIETPSTHAYDKGESWIHGALKFIFKMFFFRAGEI